MAPGERREEGRPIRIGEGWGGIMEKSRDIDSKFAVSIEGKIFKKSNGEIIPDDEPLFLLRGRDMLALQLLGAYHLISKDADCNKYHFQKLAETIGSFKRFRTFHKDRMKMPSITEGK